MLSLRQYTKFFDHFPIKICTIIYKRKIALAQRSTSPDRSYALNMHQHITKMELPSLRSTSELEIFIACVLSYVFFQVKSQIFRKNPYIHIYVNMLVKIYMDFNRKWSENDLPRYNLLVLEHQTRKDKEVTLTPGYVGAGNIDL